MAKQTKLQDLLDNAPRFFVCSTHRRGGGLRLEQRMLGMHYAAAWEPFNYSSRMEEVQGGDAIFMFAGGVGIIGVGRARRGCEILEPNAPHRVADSGFPPQNEQYEWRVPVDWYDLRGDQYACPIHHPPRCTFRKITSERHAGLLQDIRRHFLGSS